MRALVFPVMLALALVSSAQAEHCESYTTSYPEVDLTSLDPATPYYLENDPACQPECFPAFGAGYLYEETNGIEGLQRFDEWVDDTCHGVVPGDTATEIYSI